MSPSTRPEPVSVRPKKGLGQHFLVDDGAIRRIVDAVGHPDVGAAPGTRVVEIGPGEGAMTDALVRRFPGMVALEVDREAIAHLGRRHPDLDVRELDVLEADWAALRRELAPPAAGQDALGSSLAQPAVPQLHVAGNLPYYISSPILFALLDARAHVARATVMVQEEVARRLASPPGSKAYGTLSVYFALFARVDYLFGVPPGSFRPPPKVDSAVVAIDFRVPPPAVAFDDVRRVVRAAFGQRRKMLRNSLGPLAREAGVDVPETFATRRPEAVAPADFVTLAQLLRP